jgi:hypothetical protein
MYDGAELGKFLQAIRMADVKAITDCRTLTLQAEDFFQLLLVVLFFCKTSSTHDPQLLEIKHNPVRLSVSCTSSGSLLLFIFSSSILFLARSSLFLAQSCFWLSLISLLQNHPECKHNLLRSMEEKAEEYKRKDALAQAPTQEQAPSQKEPQLVKSCWNHFGLFTCLDEKTMQKCVVSCMVVCDFCCVGVS